MKHCEICIHGDYCLLSMHEIREHKCDELYVLASKDTLLKRYTDKHRFPNKAIIKEALNTYKGKEE